MKRKKYKPYKKGYFVDQRNLKYPCAGLRPTKNAAGMTYTHARSHGINTRDALSDVDHLRFYGTLDPLARSNRMKKELNRRAYVKVQAKRKPELKGYVAHNYGF